MNDTMDNNNKAMSKCLLCLNPVPLPWDVVVGEGDEEIYQKYYKCNEELLMSRLTTVQDEFLTWNCTPDCTTPFCEICFKSSEKVYHLSKQLNDLKKKLNILIGKFSLQIQQRILENRNKDNKELKSEEEEGEGQFEIAQVLDDATEIGEELLGNEISANDQDFLQDFSHISEWSILSDIKEEEEESTIDCNDTEVADPLLETPICSISEDGDLQRSNSRRDCKSNAALNFPRVILERLDMDANHIKTENIDLSSRNYGAELGISALIKEKYQGKLKNDGNLIFECPKCSKILSTSYTLRSHMAIHDREQYPCRFCERTFPNANSWKVHNRRYHEGRASSKSKDQCSICQKTFINKGRLEYHVQNVHPKRIYKCPVKTCSSSFPTSLRLKTHSLTHLEGLNFQCDQCGKGFKNTIGLRHHMNDMHLRPKRRPCPNCPKVFKSTHGLRSHRKNVHGNFSGHPCPTCGKCFSQISNLKRHEELHKDPFERRLFSCEKCGKSFTQKIHLINHEESHKEESDRKKFVCETCGKSFVYKPSFKRHQELHLMEYNTKRDKFKCDICRNKYFQNDESLYEHKYKFHLAFTQESQHCDECGHTFFGGLQMTKHRERVRNKEKYYRCSIGICKGKVTGFSTRCERLIHYREIHPSKKIPQQCRECSLVFCTLQGLQNHLSKTPCGKSSKTIQQRTGKIFPCSFCGKHITRKCKLVIHERRHTGERPFKCQTCGVAFIAAHLLKMHQLIENHVDEEDPLKSQGLNKAQRAPRPRIRKWYPGKRRKVRKCDTCDKVYTSTTNLKNHIRSEHTGERPFVCATCGKDFAVRNSLVAHELTHTGEHKDCCHVCGKSILKSNLQQHIKSHSKSPQFPCSYCGKTFSLVANMQRHERIHRGEKPFQCQFCKKAFVQKDQMKTHERTHTGEKPYSCETCGNAYSDRSTWVKHKKAHNH